MGPFPSRIGIALALAALDGMYGGLPLNRVEKRGRGGYDRSDRAFHNRVQKRRAKKKAAKRQKHR